MENEGQDGQLIAYFTVLYLLVDEFLGCIDSTTCIMRPIATDDPVAWCVSLFVCLSSGCGLCRQEHYCEVLFRVEIFGDSRHIILNGTPDLPSARGED